MSESVAAADPGPIYMQVEQILAEDMAILPIYHYTQNYVLDRTIRN